MYTYKYRYSYVHKRIYVYIDIYIYINTCLYNDIYIYLHNVVLWITTHTAQLAAPTARWRSKPINGLKSCLSAQVSLSYVSKDQVPSVVNIWQLSMYIILLVLIPKAAVPIAEHDMAAVRTSMWKWSGKVDGVVPAIRDLCFKTGFWVFKPKGFCWFIQSLNMNWWTI